MYYNAALKKKRFFKRNPKSTHDFVLSSSFGLFIMKFSHFPRVPWVKRAQQPASLFHQLETIREKEQAETIEPRRELYNINIQYIGGFI